MKPGDIMVEIGDKKVVMIGGTYNKSKYEKDTEKVKVLNDIKPQEKQ
jgi:hypothetical protein